MALRPASSVRTVAEVVGLAPGEELSLTQSVSVSFVNTLDETVCAAKMSLLIA